MQKCRPVLLVGLGVDLLRKPCLRKGEQVGVWSVVGLRTRPSKMPSPVVAHDGSIFHLWSLAILSSCSLFLTSSGLMADPTSCLLAKIRRRASFISRSVMIRDSSLRASSIRSRSLESTTKMRPWVPVRAQLAAAKFAATSSAGANPGERGRTNQKSNASTEGGSCPDHRRPRR